MALCALSRGRAYVAAFARLTGQSWRGYEYIHGVTGTSVSRSLRGNVAQVVRTEPDSGEWAPQPPTSRADAPSRRVVGDGYTRRRTGRGRHKREYGNYDAYGTARQVKSKLRATVESPLDLTTDERGRVTDQSLTLNGAWFASSHFELADNGKLLGLEMDWNGGHNQELLYTYGGADMVLGQIDHVSGTGSAVVAAAEFTARDDHGRPTQVELAGGPAQIDTTWDHLGLDRDGHGALVGDDDMDLLLRCQVLLFSLLPGVRLVFRASLPVKRFLKPTNDALVGMESRGRLPCASVEPAKLHVENQCVVMDVNWRVT